LRTATAAPSVPVAPRRGTVRHSAVPRRGGSVIACAILLATLSAAWWFGVATEDQRVVFAPALIIFNIAFGFVAILYRRDGILPLFESGTLYVSATMLYSLYPLLNFAAGGMAWAGGSDWRLQGYGMTAQEVGAFAWRHVLFLSSFVIAYLTVRGSPRLRFYSAPRPDRATEVSLSILFITFVGYTYALGAYIGPVQSVYQGGTGAELLQRAPYIVAQITHVVFSMRFTVKLAIAMMFMLRWRSIRLRMALFAWIAFEIVTTVTALGPRGEMILLLLTLSLLYHRFVKPVSMKIAVAGGAALLCGFLLFGLARSARSHGGNFRPGDALSAILTSDNEFQVLWADAYDLHVKKEHGELQIPWQLYVSDFISVVPSQFLPFAKIDPSDWYLDQLGLKDTGVGLMFGVIAQGVIGRDWQELAIRGMLLGVIFALLHRFYIRHSNSFWMTVIYLFVCIWSYYTFRATSFVLIYMFIYQCLTVWLATVVLASLLRRRKQNQQVPANI
jgi:hypothetical protein